MQNHTSAFCFAPALAHPDIRWHPHTGKGKSLLIQMLISSGTILRNTHAWYLPGLWVPLSLVKLVHKINHHTLGKLMAHPYKNEFPCLHLLPCAPICSLSGPCGLLGSWNPTAPRICPLLYSDGVTGVELWQWDPLVFLYIASYRKLRQLCGKVDSCHSGLGKTLKR